MNKDVMVRNINAKHRESTKMIKLKYEEIIEKQKKKIDISIEQIKSIEDSNKNARNDRLIARKFQVEMNKKVELLEESIVNINASLNNTKKRKCIANARAREATKKMEKAMKQYDKYSTKVKQLIDESSNQVKITLMFFTIMRCMDLLLAGCHLGLWIVS